MDFLEKEDGSFVLIESNDIPGIKGYPVELENKLLEILHSKMSI